MAGCRLIIEFLGRRHIAVDGFTFGRRAELVLDADNPYLHGIAGRFRLTGAGWSVDNAGSTLHFRLLHQSGQMIELPPGASGGVPSGHGRIRLTAGPTTYELDYFLEDSEIDPVAPAARTGTLFYGRNLSPAQLDYAVTLAESRLRGLVPVLPTHAEIARRWGVSERAVAKTFEAIRSRLRQEGVRGISHQEQLVEYLVINRIVTLEHLEDARLDRPDGPRRRAVVLAERAGTDLPSDPDNDPRNEENR